ADAEHVDFEPRLQIAKRRRRRGSETEAALPDAGERVVVLAELFLDRRQLRHAHGVEPGRIDLLEVVADVEHREAEDLECRLRGGLWGPDLAAGVYAAP